MRKNVKSIFLLLVVISVFAFMLPTQASAADTIKVGIVLPLTGPQAKFGEIEKQSFDMALEEINGGGGIKGKKLEFIMEDDTGRPEVGRSVVEKLITKDKVVMLGGGYSSSVTFGVAGVAQQNRVPFLVNTGSADKITEQGWDYIFRLNPPVSEYASGVETFLAEVVKPKDAVILHENSLFGTKGAKAFQKSCEKLGIKVLMTEGYEHGGIDFKPVLVKVKQLNPDLVYMISYIMDASLLMRQARELKLTPKLFVGGAAGFTLPEFDQNAGKAANFVVSATLWHQVLPLPGAMDYFNRFKAKYNKDTEYHGAEAYAAAYVIRDVLKRAKSFSAEDIKQALSETKLMTVFGPVQFTSYDKKTNQNRLITYVVQWQHGKLQLIWPKNLANAKYVYPVDWLREWGY
ncbi:MAG: ABC transporter substrate-binding protein [Deltaproteobacteria bacterium]|nr:ABC transporter substrate-binding protein [Deltaproteobacteria bacterium]MDH3803393.1 ABC transporter substrate-binding protein [Deltaproteobacteria bacterium]MDH3897840.1 ABC transporter substrate-binding protein [Deltaproteobacteria bacterium]MDH3928455.1 ABC transporter substrate-binding protein [Deltaproteobacteria bacterium]MDH3964558.1 ABC transporter substrate-binding protein [Deltaproteobacteria bacterium]